MDMRAVSLDDRFELDDGRVFMNGLHALTRLPIVQMRRDREAGLRTGCLISGYRGSPIGGYDQQLMRERARLKEAGIVFKPAVNEDLAATAIWGSQQAHLSPQATVDGVLGIWYGKGPGVDRSGDVFKHANAQGTAAHGGVLAIAGDDHAAKSSTLPHQSEHAFMSAVIPVLYPSSIHEFIPMGLLGIAMSRYSGCWTGMKVIADTVETTATVDLTGEDRVFATPDDFELPEGGLNIRWPDDRWEQDHRLQTYKGYAAVAFARANGVDRLIFDAPDARLGLIASGKAYEDMREALRQLGIGREEAAAIGLRVYKVGMPWPLDPEGVRHFAEGLDEVLVIEERREIIEFQIKQQLFNWRADVRPRIIGKFDHEDRPNLPLDVELTVGTVARAIADRIIHLDLDPALHDRLEEKLRWFDQRAAIRKTHEAPTARMPYFCSGCPHNTSTKVPEGSRAGAGIGCHFMVAWMDRGAAGFSQMGGEGAQWQGMAPFTDERHQFINLGDGTYYHSGLLAIRQAVAFGTNCTYKLLYNDAVAMTGGQAVDGPLSPGLISHQLRHEGVGRIVLVSDEPEVWEGADLAHGTEVRHRDEMDAVQRELREVEGVTAILYVQTCAAEKRRRRKRGKMVDPPKRILINRAVCEGCGDCSVQSNCVAVEPVETAFGRKRRINQSMCNKDYSCLKGFCPSFVTVTDAEPRTRAATAIDPETIPAPREPMPLTDPYNVAITGVGGTGVLTIGAILGMAAHLEGKASMILDMAGLAQKGGAVFSYLRLADDPDKITSPRIVTGGADLLMAADSVVAASTDGVVLCDPQRTRAVVNSHVTPVAGFVTNRDFDFRAGATLKTIERNVRGGQEDFHDFTALAEAATGDAIMTNIMLLGYALQKGLLPLGMPSVLRAIELNGVAIEENKAALHWGRRLAADPVAVSAEMGDALDTSEAAPDTLDALVAHREAHLMGYQNARLAARYRALVERVREVEAASTARGARGPGSASPSGAAETILAAPDADARSAPRAGASAAVSPSGLTRGSTTRSEMDPRVEREDDSGASADLPLTRAAAWSYAKLLSYKDEYEVARLYTGGRFEAQLRETFEDGGSLTFHLAPPLLPGKDSSGRPKKRRFGPWVLKAFGMLARMKGLRGTPLDVFGWSSERRAERRLIRQYEADVDRVLARWDGADEGARAAALALLDLPKDIRGFGPVKAESMADAAVRREELLARLDGEAAPEAAREAAKVAAE